MGGPGQALRKFKPGYEIPDQGLKRPEPGPGRPEPGLWMPGSSYGMLRGTDGWTETRRLKEFSFVEP